MFTETANSQTLEAFTEPYETVEVAAAESGILASVRLNEGDHVSANETIAELDCEVIKATLDAARAKGEAKGEVAAAESTFKQLKMRLEKIGNLKADGHASPEEVERARADASVARANLVSALELVNLNKLEVKRIEAQIRRRTISSPIDGVVIRLHRKKGELVSGSEARIATVVNLSSLRVRFNLPTFQATKLESEQEIDLLLPETNQMARGRIDFISPVTNSDSGTVRVEVIIDNQTGSFRSGVRCKLVN